MVQRVDACLIKGHAVPLQRKRGGTDSGVAGVDAAEMQGYGAVAAMDGCILP